MERPEPTKKKLNSDDLVIGHNLRRLRLARGMSQMAVAEGLGLTFQQVQKYEKGRNRLSGSRMVQICNLLGCAPDELFVGTALKDGGGKRLGDTGLTFLATSDGQNIVKSWPDLRPALARSLAELIASLSKGGQ